MGEPENVAFGKYGKKNFLFVNSERASLTFVYEVSNPSKPEFLQVLPTNVGPEGGLTIPSRNLLVIASENDSRGDKFRSTLTIYELHKTKKPQDPSLISKKDKDGLPIPFAALSGLSPHPTKKNILYA